jgi:hypothetical protein
MKQSLVQRGRWAEQSNETYRESVCASSRVGLCPWDTGAERTVGAPPAPGTQKFAKKKKMRSFAML